VRVRSGGEPGVPGEVIDGGVVVAGGSAAGSAGEGRAERGSAWPVMSSRWVVREHCLAASDGLQIDPICAPHLIGAAGPAAAHIRRISSASPLLFRYCPRVPPALSSGGAR
jgi:hypothetical protein